MFHAERLLRHLSRERKKFNPSVPRQESIAPTPGLLFEALISPTVDQTSAKRQKQSVVSTPVSKRLLAGIIQRNYRFTGIRIPCLAPPTVDALSSLMTQPLYEGNDYKAWL
jgi:hypothetical protein